MKQDLPVENIYGHTKKLRFLLKHLDIYKKLHDTPVRLLDFGCGNGTAVSRFLIQDGVKYYGVDIHKPSLEYAGEHFGGENAVFLEHVPEGVRFDVVVYMDVLEHLDDPAAFLRQHHGLMKDDGILIGGVPNGFGPFENEKRIDRWFGISKKLWWAVGMAGKVRRKLTGHRPSPSVPGGGEIPYHAECIHVQFFTKKSLFSLLREAGFRVECFTNGAFLGAPAITAFFLRGERVARLNARLADFLPHWAVSTWYFVAKRQP